MIADFVFNSLLKKPAYLIFLSKAIIVGFFGTNHLRNQVRRYSKSRFFLGIFNGSAPYDDYCMGFENSFALHDGGRNKPNNF